jgi:hypothetical protein
MKAVYEYILVYNMKQKEKIEVNFQELIIGFFNDSYNKQKIF